MTHEPECPIVAGRYDTAPSCDECDRLRAACQRGREDERGFNSCSQCGDDLTSPFICFGCLEENAAAARGDGEQA